MQGEEMERERDRERERERGGVGGGGGVCVCAAVCMGNKDKECWRISMVKSKLLHSHSFFK